MLRRVITVVAVIVVAAAIGLFVGLQSYASRTPSRQGSRIGAQDFDLVAKGHYLVTLGDCEACHTDPGQPGRPFAGGRPVETPFGLILAANITPDRETGIGSWSDEEFDAALRKGRRPDGSPLYPAMPYGSYAKMSKDDARAIRAYLNTMKPIHNAVETNQLPFPFSIRSGMWLWNALYYDGATFTPDPDKSDAWNRGAFLVRGPGHCGVCHTPKTVLGGDDTSRRLQGANLQGWFIPEITSNKVRGIGSWSEADLVAYLKTGHNRATAATGPMAEVVELSTSRMKDEDLRAIATYLKDQPGSSEDTPPPLSARDPQMVAGAAIYRDSCSACHAPNGKGAPHLFPALAEAPNVRSRDATTLIRIVLQGTRSVATNAEPTAPAMPSYGWQLSDDQIAAVLTYIRNSWGAAAPPVKPEDVKSVRSGGEG